MDLFDDIFAETPQKPLKSGIENVVFKRKWTLPKKGDCQIWFSGEKEATNFADYATFYALRCGCTKRLTISTVLFTLEGMEVMANICRALEIPQVKIIFGRHAKTLERYYRLRYEVVKMFRATGVKGDLVYSPHHAKYILAENEDGTGWLLNSSANINKNPNLENYLFTEAQEMVDEFKLFASTNNDAELLQRFEI